MGLQNGARRVPAEGAAVADAADSGADFVGTLLAQFPTDTVLTVGARRGAAGWTVRQLTDLMPCVAPRSRKQALVWLVNVLVALPNAQTTAPAPAPSLKSMAARAAPPTAPAPPFEYIMDAR